MPKATAPSQESKSAQVRALLATGMGTAAIAKKVGCSTNLVYVVKSHAGSKDKRRRSRERTPRGRPVPTAAAAGIDGVLAAVQNAERERTKLRTALQQIRSVLAEALE